MCSVTIIYASSRTSQYTLATMCYLHQCIYWYQLISVDIAIRQQVQTSEAIFTVRSYISLRGVSIYYLYICLSVQVVVRCQTSVFVTNLIERSVQLIQNAAAIRFSNANFYLCVTHRVTPQVSWWNSSGCRPNLLSLYLCHSSASVKQRAPSGAIGPAWSPHSRAYQPEDDDNNIDWTL